MPDSKELDAWLNDILALCSIDPDGPAQLLELLYEDFATSAHTFLHPDTLGPLLAAGYLNADVYARCRTIAAKAAFLTEHPELAQDIRGDARWQELFRLCAEARACKAMLIPPTV